MTKEYIEYKEKMKMKTFNVGALWIHEYKDDVTGNNHVYMTGYIDLGLHGRVKVALHANQHKMKETQPDYIIQRCELENAHDRSV